MAGSKKTTKTKDLSPKKSVKGGVRATAKDNENLTLVRAAKPKVKDLPPKKKNPKGGLAGHKTK